MMERTRQWQPTCFPGSCHQYSDFSRHGLESLVVTKLDFWYDIVLRRKVLPSDECTCSNSVYSSWSIVHSRDVKSSRPKWPKGQHFGLGLGLKTLALVSALASNIWPRPGLGLQQKNQQPRRDRPICLSTTGRHTMIHVEGIVTVPERMRN